MSAELKDQIWCILRGPTLTLKHIPKTFRSACAYELKHLVTTATDSTELYDLFRLLLFAKHVLAPVPHRRGGYRGRAQARAVLGERLRQWRSTTLATIVQALQPQTPLKRQPFLEVVAEDMDVEEEELHRLQQRINSHVAAGSLSKAAKKKLVSSGIHADCPVVAAKLRALHPQARLPLSLPEVPARVPSFDCEPGEVRATLRSFPVATAPGPTGLRVDHLRECVEAPSSAAVQGLLAALTCFATKAANGELPADFAAFVLCARLLPFKKKDDGVRPIAVGVWWPSLC